MKNLIKILIVFFAVLAACSSEKGPNSKDIRSNQIILIFKTPPPTWKVHRKAGGYTPARCEIDFVDDNFIPIQYLPDTEKEFDTLIIKTQREYIEFRHSYKGIDKLTYLFQNGDTVLFSYQDNTPIATLKNRESKIHDINLDLFKRKTLYHEEYPSYIKSLQPIFFMRSTKNLQKESERVVAVANKEFLIEINKERTFLDSLHDASLISHEIYNSFYRQTLYQHKILDLQRLLGVKHSSQGIIPNLTNENFKVQLGYDIELGYLNGDNILSSKNDSLLYFGHYQDLINWLYFYYLSKKVGKIESVNYVDGIATSGSGMPNYLSLYDTINNCSFLSSQAIKILKLKTIQNIVENNTIDEVKVAFAKFRKDINDTSMVNFVSKKYLLPNDTSAYSYDLKLSSNNSESISYNDLIKKHKGQVIYIDFWSSGCIPCIKQFEFSERLKEHYKEKDLVQIYISIEPNKKSWKKACEKYNLLTESYIAENIYSSRQFGEMNIKYVPHYYLYKKNGNLVKDFAPRPSDKKLLKLIDEYLSE